MKNRRERIKVSVLGLAVQGAMAAMLAAPVAQADNTLEVGALNVSQKSAKFGEYTGLNDKGGEFIGNLNVSGGDGATNWGIKASDLGTTSRGLNASAGRQGMWEMNLGYDELRHSISDTYQTPQVGAQGGNSFVFPATFGTFDAQANPSARVLDATQLGAFHTEEIASKRKNMSFGGKYNFSRQLSLSFDYNRLDQSGSKLQAFGNQGGNIVASGTGRAEAVAVLMNPTNYQTDSYTLGLNWLGDKGHLAGSYYGSIFRDAYNSLSWENAMFQTAGFVACASGGACAFTSNEASTMPDNQFHQLNLSGGYAFSPSTKLAGGLSYGRNTQNDSFQPNAVMQAGTGVYPQASLNGKVISRHADLKLTNQTTRNLVLSAAYKYNERDNRTASNTYLYMMIGNGNRTGVNLPYSNSKAQYELAADYRIAKGQKLRAAFEREDVERWCDGVPGGAQCVASPSSSEDRFDLGYRVQVKDNVKLNAGYVYADKKASFDHLYATNVGTYPVVNSGNKLGFAAFIFDSRKQDTYKAGVNWQVSNKLELGVSGRYAKNKYGSALGVKDSDTGGFNLDATYAYNDRSSVSAYASWQNSESNMSLGNDGSNTVAPLNIWSTKLKQDSTALGFATKHSGLMGGKLELLGDLSYSLDKSRYSTQIPYTPTCGAVTSLTCGDTPDIKSSFVVLKLSGAYQLDKKSKVVLAYQYQKLVGEDYYYNTYQYGYTPNRVMPTNELAPNYSVNVIAASYVYNFK